MKRKPIVGETLFSVNIGNATSRYQPQKLTPMVDPIYCVYSKKPIVVNEAYDYDEVVYMREDYELDAEEFDKLEDQYNLAFEEQYGRISYSSETETTHKFPDDPFDTGEKFDPDDWDRLCIKMIDCFEQAFFIRENAQSFIESQSHNLGDGAYIYVESAWRNPTWLRTANFLALSASKAGAISELCLNTRPSGMGASY